MRTRRLLGAAALTASVAVGLTGCMKVDMQMDLKPDDTVDGTMIFAISRDVAEMMGQDPETLAEEMGSEMGPTPDEGEFDQETYDDGDFVGTKVTFTDAPIDSFTAEEDSESITIVREGDEFVVEGVMDLSDTSGAEGMGDLGAGMADSMEVRIAISFPGKVTDHNGELDGNTVVWTPVYGERLEMSARGSAIEGGGGSDLPIALIAGGAAALLLIIGLVLFFVLRGRGKKGAPAPLSPEGYAMPTYAAPAQPAAGYAAPPAPPAPAAAPPAPPAPAVAPPAPAPAPPAPAVAPPAPAAAPPAPPAPAATAPIAATPMVGTTPAVRSTSPAEAAPVADAAPLTRPATPEEPVPPTV